MQLFFIALTAAAISPAQAGDAGGSAAQEIASPLPNSALPPAQGVADSRPKPLARPRTGDRILNKNESYNLVRAQEGRVGVRLGDDLSYRITGN